MTAAALQAQPHSKFPDIYKVLCLRQRQGCPCYQSPAKKKIRSRLFHAEAALATGKASNALLETRAKKEKVLVSL